MLDMPNQSIVTTDVNNQNEEVVIVNTQDKAAKSYVVEQDVQMPMCTVDFSKKRISALNAEVEVGPGTYYNSYYGQSWLMHCPGESYISITTELENVDSTKTYMLDLNHLSSIVSNHFMDARISIYVNGKEVVTGHNPNHCGYFHEQFDVSQFVITGQNLVEIRFDQGAQTNYWIQSLAIVQL
jgi:hypothetical protein